MIDDGSDERDPVEMLAEEFLERRRRGETPSLKEYTDRHPELAEDIRDVFPALAMMDDIDPASEDLSKSLGGDLSIEPQLEQLGDYRILREVGRGGMGIVYEAEQISLGRHVALKVLPRNVLTDTKQRGRFEREAKAAARLHHTNIVPVFGVGAHDGMHYYVMQFIQGLGLDEVLDELQRIQSAGPKSTPTRESALPSNRRDDASAANVARSLLTGGIQHTLIADDFDDSLANDAQVSTIDLQRSLAMRENARAGPQSGDTDATRLSDTLSQSGSIPLPGQTLSEATSGSRPKKLTYWQSVATMGVQVASALQYAHDQGIQHRDIKPSNLLLDLRGTVWVTDFGLAKTEDQENITHTGDILGTLRYMPPEAFESNTDYRSDVYSLGITLYEMLAFRPAFDERDRNKLIKQVTQDVPPRLDKVNPDIPRDLATIVHKAAERDANHRYQSGMELAEDLQRFIDDEPIKARRTYWPERLRRWTRHNKRLTASIVVAVVALLSGTGVATWKAIEARTALEREATQRNVANAARQQTRVAESKAQDALNSAFQQMALRPKDPAMRVALARHLLKQNLRDDARKQFEIALSLDPDNADSATELAKLMLAKEPPQWIVLKPSAMQATSDAQFTLEKDGSVFVSGATADRDLYKLRYKIDKPLIGALRLETIPDRRLPFGGAGRFKANGNFMLSGFTASITSQGRVRPIAVSWATSDSHTPGDWSAMNTLDRNQDSFWSVWPHVKKPHWAFFVPARPVQSNKGDLVIVLDSGQVGRPECLGRFRLSMLSDPAAVARERLRIAIDKDELAGFAALGAVHSRDGNAKSAVAAFVTAMRLTGDESARAKILDNAVALETIQAIRRLRPKDVAVRMALARHLLRRNQPREARIEFERALVMAPENAEIAGELSSLIPRRDDPTWKVLKPTGLKSEGAATLRVLKDGSVLAGGRNPRAERYTIRASAGLARIRALKLELIPDPSLPRGGFGRDVNGSCFLHELTMGAADASAAGVSRPIVFGDAVASHHRNADSQARHAIDGDLSTPWDPWPHVHKRQRAVFSIPRPFDTSGKSLVIQLSSKSAWPNCALGRFRLSVSADPSAFDIERLRNSLERKELTGFAALGAARLLQGKTEQAVSAFVVALRQTRDASLKMALLEHIVSIEEVRRETVKRRPDDMALRFALVKHLLSRNLLQSAKTHLDKGLVPARADAAGELAKLILRSRLPTWTILKPLRMKSTGGAELNVENEGVIYVSGKNPDRAIYTVEFKTESPQICAIRLDTLPDPRLPNAAAGRHPGTGNFHLAEFSAAIAPASGTGPPKRIPFSWSIADYHSAGNYSADRALDGDPNTRWDTHPLMQKRHWAMFGCKSPVPTKNGRLILKLDNGVSSWPPTGIGKFRIAILSDPEAAQAERRIQAAMRLTDPWKQLAAAYHISKNQPALDQLAARKPGSLLGLIRVALDMDDMPLASALSAKHCGTRDFPQVLLCSSEQISVRARHLPLDSYDGLTVEAWVCRWNGRIFGQGFMGDPENSIYLVYGKPAGSGWKYSGWESGQGRNYDIVLPHDGKPGWRHVAMTFDGKQQRFFIDGRLVREQTAAKPGPLLSSRPFTVGGADGLLGAIRISSTARYATRFRPPKKLQHDSKTVLLYDLSRLPDGRLRDGSGNHRHGTIGEPRSIVTFRSESPGTSKPKRKTAGK